MLLFTTQHNEWARDRLAWFAAAILAAALPASGQAAAPAPAGQPYVPSLTFAVASIRQSPPADSWAVSGSFVAPGTFRATNLTMENLLLTAYQPGAYYRISGIPDSLGWTIMFNIEAKADDAAQEKLAKLSREQQSLEQQHMLQALLADRFNLRVHWATKEGEVYDLVVRNPSKLHESTGAPPSPEELQDFGDNPIPDLYQRGDTQSGLDFVAHACPIGDLVDMLSGEFARPVVDKTGLHGKYDFVLHYHGTRMSEMDPNETNPLPPLDEAIQDQLGLKLEPDRGPVRILVVDHVEKPSAN
jgi:uncharacterized protein (TIGR03435 family)